MNFDDLNTFIDEGYDRTVSQAGGPITSADVRAKMRPEVSSALARADVNIDELADLLIKRRLDKVRPKRSRNLKRDLDYIWDYTVNPEDAAQGISALMGQAYPLGTSSGDDKTLALWTPQDFRDLVVVRYRNAAAATEEAKAFDESAERIVDAMRLADAAELGHLVTEHIAA